MAVQINPTSIKVSVKVFRVSVWIDGFRPWADDIIVQVTLLSEDRLYPKEQALIDLVPAERIFVQCNAPCALSGAWCTRG